MKCQNCGKELLQEAKFCDECGTSVVQSNNEIQEVSDASAVVPAEATKKKSVFRRWWFWLIIGIVIISVIVGVFGDDDDSELSENSHSMSSMSTTSSETIEVTTTKSAEDTEKAFKDSCSEIDFETLARNPDKYANNNYVFSGEVIQVSEGWFDNVDLRINITKTEYDTIDTVLWTDTIYATVTIPDGEDKILEGDVIKFWGTCDGDYTYESVLGAKITLPKISIEYYELVE